MTIEIPPALLMTLVWMARRYADGRSTYAPSDFNKAYERLKDICPQLLADEQTDHTCKYFPYAQDGMYDPITGVFDARPLSSQPWGNSNPS